MMQALEGVSVLDIDTAPLVYYTEDHPDYAPTMQTIFERVVVEQLQVVTSIITLTETLTKPLVENDHQLLAQYQTLFKKTEGVTLIAIEAEIAERGAELRARYNLKTPDALQIATAIHTGCDAFLTNDRKLLRVTDEIPVLVLDSLVASK